MAKIFGTSKKEKFDLTGSYIWIGSPFSGAWSLRSKNGMTNSNDEARGGSGDDTIAGGNGVDKLFGDAGRDTLRGDAGDDLLTGGLDADTLTGGLGADTFLVNAVNDSKAVSGLYSSLYSDTITDFNSIAGTAIVANRDTIDLASLVNTIKHSLTWTDTTSSAYGVWYSQGTSTIVYIDTNGNAAADMAIRLTGKKVLAVGDFAGVSTPDTTAPVVTSVTLGSNDGALSEGETVTISVTFSEAVFVNGGTPTLSLSGGGTASLVSGSGSATLVFSYTPGSGETTADLSVLSLNLAGATLRDAAGNDATLAGAAVNPDGTVSVDTTAPSTSIALNKVTADRILNSSEAAGNVSITGLVIGDVQDGDTVTLTVNGKDYTGSVDDGEFSISVKGSDLAADSDSKIDASVTTKDTAGNSTTATGSKSYMVDTTAPSASITLNAVTADNILNVSEASGDVSVTGSVGGEVQNGDTVTLTVNGTDYTGSVASGSFSISVKGSDLAADSDGKVDASVKTTDTAGNTTTATGSKSYTVDTTPPSASITLDAATADNILNAFEAGGNVAVTGSVGGDVQNGDTVTLTVNGKDYTGSVASGTFSILVKGSDLAADSDGTIDASVTTTDTAGNSTTATGSKAFTVNFNIDLTYLSTSEGFIIQGDAAYDLVGFSVSSAGDVNGDGFDDLLVGATAGDNGGLDAGEAYVIFGSATPANLTIDLTNLSITQGFIIQGDAAYDHAAISVSSAGDVNGDGFDDLIVGAHLGDNGGADAGEAYVIFGSSNVPALTLDLTDLTSTQGFIIQGDVAGDRAGYSVSSAGDVNGDGFDDLIIGAPLGDNGGADAGEAYVIFGSASPFALTIDLSNLSTAQGFIIQGDDVGNEAGFNVSSAGDVNGDGFDDLIVGAPWGDNGGNDAGEAYVIFGSASPATLTIDLTNLATAQGFIIQGDNTLDHAGWSVSSAGDVNGDGFDDLIVGSPLGDDGGINAGEAYVVFGSATPAGLTVDLTNLSSTQGFLIQGDIAGDQAGISVSSAGDVNGDGFDDLIVGAPFGDNGGTNAGEAYVLFGSASISAQPIDLSNFTIAQGFIVEGNLAGDQAGINVSSAGDVNRDGYDDLIVGAVTSDKGGTDAGEAYVIYGGTFGKGTTSVTTTGTSAAEQFIGGLGNDTLTGGGGADSFRGGAGDDVIGVTGTGFRSIDGGTGVDTLRMDGASDHFDFSVILPSRVSDIEAIDMRASGNQTLTIGKLDILAMSSETSAGVTSMTVYGSSGDSVVTYGTGWSANGQVTIGADTFNVYRNGQAELIIDTDVTIAGTLLLI